MPRYDYRCGNCGYEFEEKQSFSSEPVAECPSCQHEARRIITTVPGIVFKGSGFYVNDYGKGNGSDKAVPKDKTGDLSSKSESKKESKSESKKESKSESKKETAKT